MLDEDLLRRLMDEALKLGAGFADIRMQDDSYTSISMRDGVVESMSSGRDRGAAVRVIYGGAWGFSYTSRLDEESLRSALKRAFASAHAASQHVRRPARVVLLNPVRDVVEWKPKINPLDVDPSVKLGALEEVHKLVSAEEYVKTVTIRYMDGVQRKIYASTDERLVEETRYISWAYFWVTGREAGVMASAREELGSIDGYTIFEKWDPQSIAEKLSGMVGRQLRAKTPRGGSYPAVMAPNVVGVFVHEAFGHLAEADLTMAGSAVRDKFDQKIASEHVSIADDPTLPGGFGTFKYDDEGVKAVPARLIDKGYMRDIMLDREFAAMLGRMPTGNARAESYRVPPLIRMRNTVMLPGDHSVEELFDDIDYGYYLVSFRGGQANLDGTFQVGIQEAYEIIRGEVGEPVRNMSISGNTLETLLQVDAVAKDFSLEYGRCGKGQTAFVSDGGPHVRVKSITIGGAGR